MKKLIFFLSLVSTGLFGQVQRTYSYLDGLSATVITNINKTNTNVFIGNLFRDLNKSLINKQGFTLPFTGAFDQGFTLKSYSGIGNRYSPYIKAYHIIGDGFSTVGFGEIDILAEYQAGYQSGFRAYDGGYAEFAAYDSLAAKSVGFSAGSNPGGIAVEFFDNRTGALQNGLVYRANYGANFSSLSLIHKGFADANYWTILGTSGINGIYSTSSSGLIELRSLSGRAKIRVKPGTSFNTDGSTVLSGDNVNGYSYSFSFDPQNSEGFGFGSIYKETANIGTGLSSQVGLGGIKYAADYSANYTARSLTDRNYADTHVMGLASPSLVAGTNVTITGTFPNQTINSSGSGGVSSVTGTLNRITSTGGSTPAIDISATFEALLGKVATGLGQFASTTSAQLRTVLSDETGTGFNYFQGGDLGTPSAGVLTNASGTAASLTAGNATKWTTGRTIGITGDVTYTSPSLDGSGNVTASATVTKINGVALSGLATGMLYNTTATGVPGTVTLTTTGTSGAATFSAGTLNIPQYSGGGGSNPFADNTALVKNNADNTKLVRLSAASLTTATTRVWTFPDRDDTFIGVSDLLVAATPSNIGYMTTAQATAVATIPNKADILPNTSTISSGSASTIADPLLNAKIAVLFNPLTVIASYTATMPLNPFDGQEIEFYFGGTIAALAPVVTVFAIAPNTSQSIIAYFTPSSAKAGDIYTYTYKSSTTTWYRK